MRVVLVVALVIVAFVLYMLAILTKAGDANDNAGGLALRFFAAALASTTLAIAVACWG
jgi:hypothetical protein